VVTAIVSYKGDTLLLLRSIKCTKLKLHDSSLDDSSFCVYQDIVSLNTTLQLQQQGLGKRNSLTNLTESLKCQNHHLCCYYHSSSAQQSESFELHEAWGMEIFNTDGKVRIQEKERGHKYQAHTDKSHIPVLMFKMTKDCIFIPFATFTFTYWTLLCWRPSSQIKSVLRCTAVSLGYSFVHIIMYLP